MLQSPDLQYNRHWRLAVWSLRVGYLGLTTALVGLLLLLSGSTPWVLATGLILWLTTVAVTLSGFLCARHELPPPRPTYWSMRLRLIHDTVHAPTQSSLKADP